MNKVLVIAYFFPPAGVVGVYRTLKFLKYLPDFGWQPVALTTSNGKFGTYDESLLALVPDGVTVYRARGFELLNTGHNQPQKAASDGARRTLWRRIHGRICQAWNLMCLPDSVVGWVPGATIKALGIVRREGIRHVYVSGKPFSSFLIGCALKMFAGVKLVLDYRDPWTQNITYLHRSRLHTWLDRKLEAYVVRLADVIISNTRGNHARMVEEFGAGQPAEKFVTIHNGYDEEDFAGVPADPASANGSFTITYAGVFYYSVGSDFAHQAGNSVMRTYSPLYFFDGLERLFARRPDIKERMRVNFMGRLGHGYDPIIAEKGLDGIINRLGYVDYDEHIAVLKNSSALLLVLSRGEKSRAWIPSKFFQYLGSGNPILGLVPEGEVRTIIHQTRSGVCVEPDDVNGIARAVEEMFDAFVSGRLNSGFDRTEMGKYERRYLTELLARALDAA